MDRMNQKRVLVTGCAGFIGSNLCGRLCDEGYKVVGIDNLSAGTLENIDNRVIFHKADIRDMPIILTLGISALSADNMMSESINYFLH